MPHDAIIGQHAPRYAKKFLLVCHYILLASPLVAIIAAMKVAGNSRHWLLAYYFTPLATRRHIVTPDITATLAGDATNMLYLLHLTHMPLLCRAMRRHTPRCHDAPLCRDIFTLCRDVIGLYYWLFYAMVSYFTGYFGTAIYVRKGNRTPKPRAG
jgi:hypothetical protein